LLNSPTPSVNLALEKGSHRKAVGTNRIVAAVLSDALANFPQTGVGTICASD
jgi:hypothetical protein